MDKEDYCGVCVSGCNGGALESDWLELAGDCEWSEGGGWLGWQLRVVLESDWLELAGNWEWVDDSKIYIVNN